MILDENDKICLVNTFVTESKRERDIFFDGFSRRNFLTRQYKPTNQSVVKNYKQIQLSQCCVALAVSHTVIGT